MVLPSPYSAHPAYLQGLSFLPFEYILDLSTSLICTTTTFIQSIINTALNNFTAFKWVPCVYSVPFRGQRFLNRNLFLLKHVQGLHTAIQIKPRLLLEVSKAIQIQTPDDPPSSFVSLPFIHCVLTTLTPFQFFKQPLTPQRKYPSIGDFPKDPSMQVSHHFLPHPTLLIFITCSFCYLHSIYHHLLICSWLFASLLIDFPFIKLLAPWGYRLHLYCITCALLSADS